MAESCPESCFEDAVAYGLATLDSPHLTLKKEQLLSVKAVFEGKDVFVWLPTGFGKSLCYHILPCVFHHKLGLVGSGRSSAVLVVSPLVSLMVDQLQRLRNRGAKVSIITTNARCEFGDKLTELSGPGTSSAFSVLSVLDVLSAPRESELGEQRKTKLNPPQGKRKCCARPSGRSLTRQ